MVRPSDPLTIWREEIGRRLLNLDFKPLSDVPFRASIVPVLSVDEVRVAKSALTPGLTFRDEDLIKDGTDSIAVVFSRNATLEINHIGRTIRVAPGEATLLDNSRPATMGAAKSHRYVGVLVPPQALRQVTGLGPIFARRLPRSSPALDLLKAYISCLDRTPCTSPEVQVAAGRHVADLVRVAVNEQLGLEPEPESTSVPAVRLRIALAVIAERFRDPELSVLSVAARLAISPRYLQRLFEVAGIRFTQHVNDLRLDEAHFVLSDPGANSRTIAEIAFAAGFSDVSHFNRMFRRRFDATPSAVRSQHATRA